MAELRRGFTPLFTIYDDDDQISILKSVYKQLGLDEKFLAYRAALSRISHAKSHKDTPEDLARAATDPISTTPGRHLRTLSSASCWNRTRWISTICCSKPCACWPTMQPTREKA